MRYIPILIIILFAVLTYTTGLTKYISLDYLKNHHQFIKNFIKAHPSSPLYLSFVILSLLHSLPVDTLLALLGGLLFPEPYSLLYVIVGSSTGATFLFWLPGRLLAICFSNGQGPC